MSKYSLKPWKSNGNDILDADDMVVCSFGKYSEQFTGEEIEEINANAQLIVAAPELLDIAEYSLKIVENLPCECDSYNGFTCKKHEWERKLRKAINKAKGADE